MTKFKAGDEVIAEIKGLDHDAIVIEQRGAYVMVRTVIDPTWDYGRTTWIDPEPVVCCRETNVRHKTDTPQ